MFSEFRMNPAVSGRILCGIVRVLVRVSKSRVKNFMLDHLSCIL